MARMCIGALLVGLIVVLANLGLSSAASAQNGWLGAELLDLTPNEAGRLGWPRPKGALINGLSPDSPALRAGLRPADIILTVNGMEIGSAQAIATAVRSYRPGQMVEIGVFRLEYGQYGQEVLVNVVLGTSPAVTVRPESRPPRREARPHRAPRTYDESSDERPSYAPPHCSQSTGGTCWGSQGLTTGYPSPSEW